MTRIIKDLNAEVVEIGDPKRIEENPHKNHESARGETEKGSLNILHQK